MLPSASVPSPQKLYGKVKIINKKRAGKEIVEAIEENRWQVKFWTAYGAA